MRPAYDPTWTRVCRTCKNEKQQEAFEYLVWTARFNTQCRVCTNARTRALYTPERGRRKLASRRARRAKDPEKFSKQEKEYRLTYPERVQNARLKNKYNISLADKQRLASEQDNRCKICRLEKRLVVDHKGPVRGLLCDDCNRGLGCFRDNITFCLSAADYLKEFIEKGSPIHAPCI